MMQSDGEMVREDFGFEANPLVRAAPIGVLHEVAGRFVDRQLECCGALFLERRAGKIAAKSTDEFACLAKITEIAADLYLRPRDRELSFFHSNCKARQVI